MQIPQFPYNSEASDRAQPPSVRTIILTIRYIPLYARKEEKKKAVAHTGARIISSKFRTIAKAIVVSLGAFAYTYHHHSYLRAREAAERARERSALKNFIIECLGVCLHSSRTGTRACVELQHWEFPSQSEEKKIDAK